MNAIYLDCTSGISGNMFLGACLQLGVPVAYLKSELAKLNFDDDYSIEVEDVSKNGIAAVHVNVVLPHDHHDEGHHDHGAEHHHEHSEDHHEHHHANSHEHDDHDHHEHHHADSHEHDDHDHYELHHADSPEHDDHDHHEHHHADSPEHDAHDHHEHHHRSMADIRKIIEGAALSLEVKKIAMLIFEKLAAAEGKVHNRPADQVTFHEVGAVDSIVDIVGCAICIDYLDIVKVFVSKINVGDGFVRCAHGLMPVPAPATAELLMGFPTCRADYKKELTTPTGAAIIAALAEYSESLPDDFVVEKIAYGAGTYDLPIPNVLRIYLGNHGGSIDRQLKILETNIDDMNPQIYGHLYDRLLDAGARDVWTTPIYMKKNRPAHTLSVLVDADHESSCTKIIFQETTTLGLRVINVERRIEATRRMAKVDTSFGEVACKVSAFDGHIVSITPEYEDCRRLAIKHNVPLKNVWLEALAKQHERLDL